MISSNPNIYYQWKHFSDTSSDTLASNDNLDMSTMEVASTERSTANECGSDSISNMINFISEGIFAIDRNGIIEMINPTAANMFGQSRDMLIGRSLLDFLGANQSHEYIGLFESLLSRDNQVINHGPKEIKLVREDGSCLEADLSLSNLPESFITDRKLIIGVMHDLTSHKAEYGKLKRLARTDFLTGLANRHAFEESLNTNWLECVSDEMPLSLMVIDVDHFKLFNDEHGHVTGDKCLQRIAKTIESCLPARNCLAARYGGEEFALVMPHCHSQIAQLVAIRIKRQVEALTFEDLGLGKDVNITVSVGIACQQKGLYHTAEALLCSSDIALYRAKEQGRNRICCV